ncbi:SLAIN motif-containing protein 1a [Cololabis saira]|uniref:SLAIN motif-containing protein 1a n=1 Tax=Cololabis saira TaxID=129043 RepID=UPI002AD2F646|nr:SLAIN motif-containing protein 1a [Cololabis saira]
MEAEVLNPPPDPCSSSSSRISSSRISSAELEVLKLQELVRQLERQNQQLRCRAGNPGNPGHPGNPCSSGSGGRLGLRYDPPGAHGGTHGCRAAAEEEPLAYFQPSCVPGSEEEDGGAATVLDQVELLDLSVLLPTQDPDRWLYVSPRAGLQSDSVLSPLQWCRRVLDHLGPEVELAKMTLCSRLDQDLLGRFSILHTGFKALQSCDQIFTSEVGVSPRGRVSSRRCLPMSEGFKGLLCLRSCVQGGL